MLPLHTLLAHGLKSPRTALLQFYIAIEPFELKLGFMHAKQL
jgi:hypothetical protein